MPPNHWRTAVLADPGERPPDAPLSRLPTAPDRCALCSPSDQRRLRERGDGDGSDDGRGRREPSDRGGGAG